MDMRIYLRLLGLMLVWWCLATDATAQLFGARQLRNPLIRQNSAGSGTTDTGTLQGNERFLRGNRSATDFVGTANRDEVGFVGQVNSLNLDPSQIPTAIGLLRRANRAPQINRPVQRHRPNTLQEPLLELAFEPPPGWQQQLAAAAEERLGRLLAERFESQIAVSVEGRTATLRGEVDDAAAARLAETLATLEPGVSEVRNEIRLRNPD